MPDTADSLLANLLAGVAGSKIPLDTPSDMGHTDPIKSLVHSRDGTSWVGAMPMGSEAGQCAQAPSAPTPSSPTPPVPDLHLDNTPVLSAPPPGAQDKSSSVELEPSFDLNKSWLLTQPEDVQTLASSDASMAGMGRFFQAVVPTAAQNRNYAEVCEALDVFTPEAVLEELSRGLLPVEFAARYGVPFMHFDKWLSSDAVDQSELARAMRLAADVYAARSKAVLEVTPGSAQEAAMMREYSKRALEMAERIAPDSWATRRRTEDQADMRQSISIAIMAPPGSIPGVGLLQGVGLGPGSSPAVIDHKR